jgi:hypothetical protein
MGSKKWFACALTIAISCADSASKDETTTVRSALTLTLATGLAACDFDNDGKCDVATWRPSTTNWAVLRSSGAGVLQQRLLMAEDVPTPGDYDGDHKTDFATWTPSSGVWNVIPSGGGPVMTQQWGAAEDIPVAGEYDGDGKTDFATFRPSIGQWAVFKSTGGTIVRTLGQPGDIPVPGDYDGDQKTDLAIWRPSTGTWKFAPSGGGSLPDAQSGAPEDIPVPADYDGDGKTDIATFRPSTRSFIITQSSDGAVVVKTDTQFKSSDIPVPGDFDHDGKADIVTWAPSTGIWTIVSSSTGSRSQMQWGAPEDVPNGQRRPHGKALDIDGDRKADFATWSPASGTWHLLSDASGSSSPVLGGPGDAPFLADIDGDGKRDRVTFTPKTGLWSIAPANGAATSAARFGLNGMVPTTGDFDGDGKTDLAVLSEADLNWAYRPSAQLPGNPNADVQLPSFGNHDVFPVPADFDGDGKTDPATWAPLDGTWSVRLMAAPSPIVTQQWGQTGDIPVPADYDGDRKADFAYWRPSTGVWATILSSSGATTSVSLGTSTDVPAPADYDGDGKADIAVWTASTGTLKYVGTATGTTVSRTIGAAGDLPLAGGTSIVPLYYQAPTLTSVDAPTVSTPEALMWADTALWEFSAAVAPAGTSGCSLGRKFSSGTTLTPTGVINHLLMGALACPSAGCMKDIMSSITTDHPDDFIENDNVMTRLPDGTMMLVRGVLRTAVNPQLRSGTGIWTSPPASCGAAQGWTFRTFIDPSDNVRYPPPEKATDPTASYGTYQNANQFGGWDREEVYADPFSSSVFAGMGGAGSGTQDTLLFRSTDAGASWLGVPFTDGVAQPVMMTSFPNRLLVLTCKQQAPLLWWSDDGGATVQGGVRVSWRYPCRKVQYDPQHPRNIDGSLLIGRAQWNQDRSGTARIIYPSIGTDGHQILVQFNVGITAGGVVSPRFVRTIGTPGRDAYEAVLVEPDVSQAGMSTSTKSLLYWLESDATTTRVRGLLLNGLLVSSAQFDVSTDSTGASRSWADVSERGDYQKGASAFDGLTQQIRYYATWLEPDGLHTKVYAAPVTP